MFINIDILVHHVSRYTNIRTTYNLFTTCKDLYKHIDEVLNLDDEPITSITSSISRDRRILTLLNINESINKISEFKLLEVLTLNNDDVLRLLNFNLYTNLSSLTITKLDVSNSMFKLFVNQLQYKCKQLEYLKLSNILFNEHDDSICIKQFNNLHTLYIRCTNSIEVRDLNNIINLKLCSYNGCIIKDLKTLKKLSIKGYENNKLSNLPSLNKLTLKYRIELIINTQINIKQLVLKSIRSCKTLRYYSNLFNNVTSVKLVYSNYNKCYNHILKYIPSIESLTINILSNKICNNILIKDYHSLKDLSIYVKVYKHRYTCKEYDIIIQNIFELKNVYIYQFYDYINKDFNISNYNKILRRIRFKGICNHVRCIYTNVS